MSCRKKKVKKNTIVKFNDYIFFEQSASYDCVIAIRIGDGVYRFHRGINNDDMVNILNVMVNNDDINTLSLGLAEFIRAHDEIFSQFNRDREIDAYYSKKVQIELNNVFKNIEKSK